MMMAIPAAIEVAVASPQAARDAIAALALYIAIYLFMNTGAFAIVALFRNGLGTEQIKDYSGLIRRSPLMVIMLSLILFSLVGLPPLAGFLGKFAIFAALTNSWRITDNTFLIALLAIAGLNTAISLFYYLRVVKVMTIDPELDSNPAVSAPPVSMLGGSFVMILTIPVVTLLLYSDQLNVWTQKAAELLF
jgi:NADH-quinone oxidoreductase subunit N